MERFLIAIREWIERPTYPFISTPLTLDRDMIATLEIRYVG